MAGAGKRRGGRGGERGRKMAGGLAARGGGEGGRGRSEVAEVLVPGAAGAAG